MKIIEYVWLLQLRNIHRISSYQPTSLMLYLICIVMVVGKLVLSLVKDTYEQLCWDYREAPLVIRKSIAMVM